MIKNDHFWENRKYFVSGFRNRNAWFMSPKKRRHILAHFESFCWRKSVRIVRKHVFFVLLGDRIFRIHCHPIYLWESVPHRKKDTHMFIKFALFSKMFTFLHDFCVFKKMKKRMSFYRNSHEFREPYGRSEGCLKA